MGAGGVGAWYPEVGKVRTRERRDGVSKSDEGNRTPGADVAIFEGQHIRRQWLEHFPLETLGSRLCFLNALCILAAVEVVLHTPVALEISGRNFAKLTFIYMAAAVPFFCTGVLFSVLFARCGGNRISQLYGADLAGGSLACLAVVPLLNQIGAPNALLLASVTMVLAAALWSEKRRMRVTAFALAGVFLILAAANHSGRFRQTRCSPW